MDDDLQFLVHFFNDKVYLFKTITMAGFSQMDDICNRISSQKGWYWRRFASSERHAYLQRRLFVEKELYEGYTQAYGSLKEKVPVYFYLYPNLTKQEAIELAHQRTRHDETEPQILIVSICDIEDTQNITFTLNDSLTAYWKKAAESGLEMRGDRNARVVLPDHNQVFPFSMIEQIHRKNKAQHLSYEIQIWDYQLLERIRYTILGKEEACPQPNTACTRPSEEHRDHGGGSLRVFGQFAWLGVGSDKMALSQPSRLPLTAGVDCKEICNRKSATTSVTVLTRRTATTSVTPSGVKARRCSHENREPNSPTSRCPASARLEEE